MSTAFQIPGCPKKLTIRIELIGIQPAIWREIEVPSNISADELAYVLELVMGWSGSHLPAFMVGKQEYMLSEDCIDGIEDFALPYDDMTASDLFESGKPVKFLYDFGDGWEHKLSIIGAPEDYAKGEHKLPRYLRGERACPPEDVGGVPGYMEMLEVIKKPNSKAAKEYFEWIGYRYDPERLNEREIRSDLAFFRQHGIFPWFADDEENTEYFS